MRRLERFSTFGSGGWRKLAEATGVLGILDARDEQGDGIKRNRKTSDQSRGSLHSQEGLCLLGECREKIRNCILAGISRFISGKLSSGTNARTVFSRGGEIRWQETVSRGLRRPSCKRGKFGEARRSDENPDIRDL